MSLYRVLIVGDSHMRHFEAFLNNTTLNIRYTVVTLPGANLNRIATVAAEMLDNNFSFHLTIIAGGINDLSMLRHIPSRHARPRFNSIDILVDYTVEEMRRCIQHVRNHSYMPVALATLSGMHLSQYSPNLWDFLFTYQPIVDQAIPLFLHIIYQVAVHISIDYSACIWMPSGLVARRQTTYNIILM